MMGRFAGWPERRKTRRPWQRARQTATAGTLDGNVEILGLPACSAQGDKEILTLVERFGGKVVRKGETVWACGENLHGIDIDVSQIPDLVPPLAVIALAAKGKTRLYNAARLRMKESDRLSALAQQFCALRASIAEGPDFLEIDGGAPLCGGVVSACNDHRIAMAVAVASQMAAGEVTVLGAECVEKSYPDFWDVFRKIGGKLHE